MTNDRADTTTDLSNDIRNLFIGTGIFIAVDGFVDGFHGQWFGQNLLLIALVYFLGKKFGVDKKKSTPPFILFLLLALMTVLVVLDFVSDPQPSRLKEFIVTAGLLAAISGFAFSISRKLKALTQG